MFIMHSAAFIAWLKSLVKCTFINSDCPKAILNHRGGNTDTQASKVLQDPKMLQCPWQSWVQSPVSLSQARTMDPRQNSPIKLTLLFMSFLQKWSSLFSSSQHSATPKKHPSPEQHQNNFWFEIQLCPSLPPDSTQLLQYWFKTPFIFIATKTVKH